MKLTRRNFLAWAGLSAVGAVACEGFGIREGELSIQSSTMLPEDLVRGQDNWYATLCRSCPCAEGIVVRVMDGRAKKIQGNPLYPVNHGKQSPRCEAGLQAVYHPDRVSGPMLRFGARGSGHFTPISWTEAGQVSPGPTGLGILRQELADRGQRSLLVTEPLRGHLALVAQRFAAAVGGRHLGFETLDDNTYRTAVKNVFGQDNLPDLDLANASFLLSFGADFLSTWGSPTRWSRAYGDFRQTEGRPRGTFYHVDSRFSMTAANADRWVPINPGWEGHLAMSLAYVIISEERQAQGVDVMAMTNGQGAAALQDFRPEAVAQRIGLTEEIAGGNPVDFIVELARQFADSGSSLALGGGSAGAHNNGLFNLEAIYALNTLVGTTRVRFNPSSPLEDVPAASNVGTLNDWEEAAESILNGGTRLLMLHNADPVLGLPGAVNLKHALDQAEDLFIVSFSPFIDETSVMADLILPDRLSLEDWGDDIPEPGPGYQVLGFQQPVVNPLHDLDPLSFPDVLLTMAQELGRDDDLPWANYQRLLREGSDALFALGRGSIQSDTAGEFWTSLLRNGGWWDESETGPAPSTSPAGLFNDIAAKSANPTFTEPAGGGSAFYLVPFSHNTLLDGRHGHIPWLQAAPDPLTTITWQTWVEMNDRSASDLGLREGDVVRIESAQGSIRALLYPTPAVPHGVIGVPLGQGRRNGSEYASARPGTESSNVMDILAPSRVDGTGALAWAGTRVTVSDTGSSMKVSKFEGNVRAVEIGIHEGERIIHTIPGDA